MPALRIKITDIKMSFIRPRGYTLPKGITFDLKTIQTIMEFCQTLDGHIEIALTLLNENHQGKAQLIGHAIVFFYHMKHSDSSLCLKAFLTLVKELTTLNGSTGSIIPIFHPGEADRLKTQFSTIRWTDSNKKMTADIYGSLYENKMVKCLHQVQTIDPAAKIDTLLTNQHILYIVGLNKFNKLIINPKYDFLTQAFPSVFALCKIAANNPSLFKFDDAITEPAIAFRYVLNIYCSILHPPGKTTHTNLPTQAQISEMIDLFCLKHIMPGANWTIAAPIVRDLWETILIDFTLVKNLIEFAKALHGLIQGKARSLPMYSALVRRIQQDPIQTLLFEIQRTKAVRFGGALVNFILSSMRLGVSESTPFLASTETGITISTLMEHIKEKTTISLKTEKILPDGNCLFGAILSQIRLHKGLSSDAGVEIGGKVLRSASDLRATICEYLESESGKKRFEAWSASPEIQREASTPRMWASSDFIAFTLGWLQDCGEIYQGLLIQNMTLSDMQNRQEGQQPTRVIHYPASNKDEHAPVIAVSLQWSMSSPIHYDAITTETNEPISGDLIDAISMSLNSAKDSDLTKASTPAAGAGAGAGGHDWKKRRVSEETTEGPRPS